MLKSRVPVSGDRVTIQRYVPLGSVLNKRLICKPSDNLQQRNNVISKLLHKYEAG